MLVFVLFIRKKSNPFNEVDIILHAGWAMGTGSGMLPSHPRIRVLTLCLYFSTDGRILKFPK